MKALQKIIRMLKLDAMAPEFKAANDELLKAIKLNDKSGAIPHAEFEAVNKAFKANDAGKAAELLKKIQLNLSKAEKKLNDEVKDVSQREADAKKENEDAKLKSKNAKDAQVLFDKAKTLANSLKTSPKSASKLTPIAEKLKAYGDISGKANKVIQLVAANKEASKQIDILTKAIDSAEKKFKKELAEIQKSEKAAKDKLEVLKMRSKVTKGKLDAFTKERLSIAKVVKQIPGSDLRQKGKEPIDLESEGRNNKKTTYEYYKNSDRHKKVGYGAFLFHENGELTVEVDNNVPDPPIIKNGIWMGINQHHTIKWVPEGDPRFKPTGGDHYLVWGKSRKEGKIKTEREKNESQKKKKEIMDNLSSAKTLFEKYDKLTDKISKDFEKYKIYVSSKDKNERSKALAIKKKWGILETDKKVWDVYNHNKEVSDLYNDYIIKAKQIMKELGITDTGATPVFKSLYKKAMSALSVL